MYPIVRKIKMVLYFRVAAYFRFWASIKLKRWKPKIIVITGSNGKTFLLSLFAHQLADQACYTFGANSAFGIPFYILDLQRKNYSVWEWLVFFFKSPFAAVGKTPSQKLLFIEADCDRNGEGKFLASFLNPDITLWQNVSLTHSANFSPPTIERIAQEFGYFLEQTSEAVLINRDSPEIKAQLSRTKAKLIAIKKTELKKYQVSLKGTNFNFSHLPYILPEDSFYGLEMLKQTLSLLNKPFNNNFSGLRLEPGRNSLFKGIKETMILDSTYNSNLSSTKSLLETVNKIDYPQKWLVIGDMVDLGLNEKTEHARLAEILNNANFTRLILVGRRNSLYALPRLRKKNIVSFLRPQDALDYLKKNLEGKELVLVKGAGFLEGIVEKLLKDPGDNRYLCRREKVWEERRRHFYA